MKSTGTDALSRFKTLEERIARLLDALIAARNEKATLERELAEIRSQTNSLQDEMESMRNERLKISKRIQRVILNIKELDSKKEEKIV